MSFLKIEGLSVSSAFKSASSKKALNFESFFISYSYFRNTTANLRV